MAQKSKRDPREIRPTDVKIATLTFLLGTGFILNVPGPSGSFINELLIAAIPAPVATLLFVIPIGIYISMSIRQLQTYEDKVKELAERKAEASEKRILVRAQVKDEIQGSSWKVQNAGSFDWGSTQIILELQRGQDTLEERHTVPHLTSGETLLLNSALESTSHSLWKITVITPQGRICDFPTQWMDVGGQSPQDSLVKPGSAKLELSTQ